MKVSAYTTDSSCYRGVIQGGLWSTDLLKNLILIYPRKSFI